MRCPALSELPPAPPGKTGWPWTMESPPVPEARADGSPWPRVSVVTPSYNQGRFIEETIRTVLLQGYPDLEYIIIDGGSTDGSVDIIRRYEPWLAYWVSEPDRGQSHAINKGYQRASGEILSAFLSSDDLYLPGAVGRAAEALLADPGVALVYSDGWWIEETSSKQKFFKSGPLDARLLLTGGNGLAIPEPTVFMRQAAVRGVGGMDESLHMAMDFDLWVKLALRYRLGYLEGQPLAMLRDHVLKKTTARGLEGLQCSLAVLERGFKDPLCPPGISARGNRAYAYLSLEIARFYLRNRRDYSGAISHFLAAFRAQPTEIVQRLANQGLIGLYQKVIPGSIQQLIRRLRGTADQGWVPRNPD